MRRFALLAVLALMATQAPAAAKLLYGFESGTDGFAGKTQQSSTGATEGKSALEIDATGSAGWNQNLAVLSKHVDWTEALEFQADVTMPQGTKGGAEYVQFVLIFSGPKSNWYEAGKVELQDGLNKVKIKIDGHKVETPWKMHLVLNSGKAIPGKIYVDNIRMHLPGKPGSLKIKVVDGSGPVSGALVAVGKVAEKTGPDGVVEIKMNGDEYPAEVLGEGLVATPFNALIPSGGSAALTVKVARLPKAAPMAVRAWVQAEKPGIPFDGIKIYGHNMAMWSGLDPFVNQEHLKKIRALRAFMIRIPGGEYGNRWDWRSGAIKKLDKTLTIEWTPEATWPVWKKFFKDLGPQTEAILILNTFYGTPDDQVAWIRDARDSGIKVRYIELNNEPDLFPERYFQGEEKASTDVAKFVKGVVPFAKAVRKAFPDIKILGPTTAQIENRECIGQSPWLCNKYDKNGELMDDPAHEDWIKKFLRLMAKEGDLVDGIAVHSYPYYPRWLGQKEDVWDAKQAFSKVPMLAKYMQLYRKWLKEFYPAKADRMDIALTEYHLQVAETWVTSDVESAVFNANYLAEFIKGGGTLASAWDINTMKFGDGGGHGLMDPTGDPTRPYAERAKYWAFKMMANNFTGAMVPAQSSNPQVAAYAAKDRGRTTLMLINRDPLQTATVSVQISGAGAVKQMRQMDLNRKGFLWSKVLYRAVINEDPTTRQKVTGAPVDRSGWRVFSTSLDPMSMSLYVLE